MSSFRYDTKPLFITPGKLNENPAKQKYEGRQCLIVFIPLSLFKTNALGRGKPNICIVQCIVNCISSVHA
jgi:hypothetical protein